MFIGINLEQSFRNYNNTKLVSMEDDKYTQIVGPTMMTSTAISTCNNCSGEKF